MFTLKLNIKGKIEHIYVILINLNVVVYDTTGHLKI